MPVDFYELDIDTDNPNFLYYEASAEAIGGGIFLTASHLFHSYYEGVETKATSQSIDHTFDASAPLNLRNYNPDITKPGGFHLGAPVNDLAIFNSPTTPVSANDISPIVTFADPGAAAAFLNSK